MQEVHESTGTRGGRRKLEALEKSVATLDGRTRQQFEEVYMAIRALMTPPAAKSRPIGFTADLDCEP